MVERKSIKDRRPVEVLYLSYDGLTDPLGQSQVLPYLRGLSAKRYRITVVSFEKSERFERISKDISLLCTNYDLTWVPLFYHKNPPVLSTLYDLFILRKTVLRLQQEKKFSIVHCRSYITALTGLWLKRKYQIKLVFDMRGFWVDERVEGGLWNLQNPIYSLIYKYFKRKEKEFINNSDAVVVLTQSAKQEVLSWNPLAYITIIPTCVDLKEFDAARFADKDRNEIRLQLGIGGEDFILLYLGSLGTWYLYKEMVSFFIELKKVKPAAKFLFITQDIDKVEIHNDFIIRAVSRNEVPRYISACDASICFIKPSFSKKGSSATKMAEVLAMGLPLITNPGWGDVEFLQKQIENVFVFSEYNEIKIREFFDNFSLKNQNTNFYNLFSLEKGVDRYSEVYQIITLQ
jgi:glycosyltransferase involved in cell wall biosynthesis